jgi:hypothetical protein
LSFLALVILALPGCAGELRPSPKSARVASPASVTKGNPGGDAANPVDAALERLLREPVGRGNDAWETLDVPLPDRKHWKGTRFKRYPTRAAYQYGSAYIALSVVVYTEAEPGADSPSACLLRLARKARGFGELAGVDLGPMRRQRRPYGEMEGDMVLLRTHGEYQSLLSSKAYEGALVAYPSWPGTCLVQGFAARVGTDRALARRVVSRWVEDAAPRLAWRVERAPALANR